MGPSKIDEYISRSATIGTLDSDRQIFDPVHDELGIQRCIRAASKLVADDVR